MLAIPTTCTKITKAVSKIFFFFEEESSVSLELPESYLKIMQNDPETDSEIYKNAIKLQSLLPSFSSIVLHSSKRQISDTFKGRKFL